MNLNSIHTNTRGNVTKTRLRIYLTQFTPLPANIISMLFIHCSPVAMRRLFDAARPPVCRRWHDVDVAANKNHIIASARVTHHYSLPETYLNSVGVPCGGMRRYNEAQRHSTIVIGVTMAEASHLCEYIISYSQFMKIHSLSLSIRKAHTETPSGTQMRV